MKQILLAFIVAFWTGINGQISSCNQTHRISQSLVQNFYDVRLEEIKENFICILKFESEPNETLSVKITAYKVAELKDGRCKNDYVRISNSYSCNTETDWFPPTIICGSGDQYVLKTTNSNYALIEIVLQNGQIGDGVTFYVSALPKGPAVVKHSTHCQAKLTESLIPGTRCDMMINVESWREFCILPSPGFPGVYPPNTRCRYLFNYPRGRVIVHFQERDFLDLRQSDNCSDDYLEARDGPSELSPLLGRYCGNTGPYLVSTGTSLLLIFNSGLGYPPWNFKGFNFHFTHVWDGVYDFGTLAKNTRCDWTVTWDQFSKSQSTKVIKTPETQLPKGTRCSYTFIGRPNHVINLKVTTFSLKADCKEKLSIQEGGREVMHICQYNKTADLVSDRFQFTSTCPTVTAVYFNELGQTSNLFAIMLSIAFMNTTQPQFCPPQTTSNELDTRDITAKYTTNDSIPKDSITKDSIIKDSINKDSINKAFINKDSIRKDTVTKDSTAKDSVTKNSYSLESKRNGANSA